MSGDDLKKSLNDVRMRIEEAKKKRPDVSSFVVSSKTISQLIITFVVQDLQYINPRLVAVSKTKPLELIFEAYEAGQRHFGENYAQELITKATDPQVNYRSFSAFVFSIYSVSDFQVLEKCGDIKWHFIGHLQSNKAAKVVTLPNLYIVETVHSQKIAASLNEALSKNKSSEMNVYVQVNTSAEDGQVYSTNRKLYQ